MATTERTKPSREELMERLRGVEDPELRMSIVELGLVYDAEVNDEGVAKVTMTLTTPACPMGPVIGGQAYSALIDLPGVEDVDVNIVFSPPWDPKTMASDDVKMQLGIW